MGSESQPAGAGLLSFFHEWGNAVERRAVERDVVASRGRHRLLGAIVVLVTAYAVVNAIVRQVSLVDNGKAEIMLTSFVDYPRQRWRTVPLGDFVAFVAD